MSASVGTHKPRGGARVARAVLALAIVLGVQALWLLVPIATLWAVGRLVDTTESAFFVAMLAIPAALVAFAFLLAAANRHYLRLAGRGAGRGPLEAVLPASIVLALLTLSVWFVFFASHAPSGREQLIP